jgi:hypothetical protein
LWIGLSGANFTLIHSIHENHAFYWDERIEFDSLDGMALQFKTNLNRGLPVAILELQEQVHSTIGMAHVQNVIITYVIIIIYLHSRDTKPNINGSARAPNHSACKPTAGFGILMTYK